MKKILGVIGIIMLSISLLACSLFEGNTRTTVATFDENRVDPLQASGTIVFSQAPQKEFPTGSITYDFQEMYKTTGYVKTKQPDVYSGGIIPSLPHPLNEPNLSFGIHIGKIHVHSNLGGGLFISSSAQQGGSILGISNEEGNFVLQPSRYHYISLLESESVVVGILEAATVHYEHTIPKLFEVRENDRFGYLLYNHQLPNNPFTPLYSTDNERFSYAFPFQGDYAVVGIRVEGKPQFGIINKQGQYVLEPEYDYIHEEIVGGYAIVAKTVQFKDEFTPYQDGTKIQYYSDSVGLYNLNNRSFVLPLEHKTLTRLDHERYFAMKANQETSFVYNIYTSSKVEQLPFYNMVGYSELYDIGMAEYRLYLVQKSNYKPIAKYERYTNLLEILRIPPLYGEGIRKQGEEGRLQYNFNTYLSTTLSYLNRFSDFIRYDKYLIVNSIDIYGSDTFIQGRVIDAYGSVVYRAPQDVMIVENEKYVFHSLHLNENVIEKTDLIRCIAYEDRYGLDKSFHYRNLDGTVVRDDIQWGTRLFLGYAVVVKEVEIKEFKTAVYMRMDREGNLTILDLGFNYFDSSLKNLPEEEQFKSHAVNEISDGIYEIHYSVGGQHQRHAINAFGEVLLANIPSLEGRIGLTWLGRIAAGFEELYLSFENIHDVFTYSSSAYPFQYHFFERNHRNNLPQLGSQTSSRAVVSESTMMPFIIQLASFDNLTVKKNGQNVPNNVYEMDFNFGYLTFTKTYLESLSSGRHDFQVASASGETTITVFKGDYPTLPFRDEADYGVGYQTNYQTVAYPNHAIVIPIGNVTSLSSIQTLRLNGVNVLPYLSEINLFNLDHPQEGYALYLQSSLYSKLENGYYMIEIGNDTRTLSFVIRIEVVQVPY